MFPRFQFHITTCKINSKIRCLGCPDKANHQLSKKKRKDSRFPPCPPLWALFPGWGKRQGRLLSQTRGAPSGLVGYWTVGAVAHFLWLTKVCGVTAPMPCLAPAFFLPGLRPAAAAAWRRLRHGGGCLSAHRRARHSRASALCHLCHAAEAQRRTPSIAVARWPPFAMIGPIFPKRPPSSTLLLNRRKSLLHGCFR